ncbi:YbhB/YbcL family Raf kinase inhibitor-like protein [uncultured Shewanella sp.]|uniref:YbhB/YbcL family Raf kinase inhibitor-like protein n=1 Tax=uncultured Shewanella sp. TaxID=173975 RepID=UPI0026343B57|nr:YbhB/YbcL family Raf kinase inhibitor-like protein [uncultured Shewanella sp.]
MAFALCELTVSSTAFEQLGSIPNRHTGEAENLSPYLSWANIPEGCKSFAVVCHDPDAPRVSADGSYGFVHWVLYNIPSTIRQLEENNKLYTSGHNDFGRLGYGGPMPPKGHGIHLYYFLVLALNKELDLPEGLTMRELLSKVEPNLIGMNRLVGKYQRD